MRYDEAYNCTNFDLNNEPNNVAHNCRNCDLYDFAKNARYSAAHTSRYSARFSSLSNYRRD